MAKVLFGIIATDMRGKLGGHVFAKNRGGAYVRTKVTPVNPQTVAQQSVRAVFTELTQGWRAISQTKIAAWNSAVQNFPRTNVFGNPKTLSGHQLFVGLNAQLGAAGQASITNPPLPVGADAVESLTGAAAETGQTFSVAYLPATVPSGHTAILDATAQVSPGQTNLNNKFRQVSTIAAAGTSPEDFAAAYTAKFGDLIAGQKIGLRMRFVNNLTGEVSGNIKAQFRVNL